MRPLTGFAAAVALSAAPAAAHVVDGAALAPPGWTWDLWVTLPLGVTLALFITGWMRLRARSGAGAGQLRRRGMLFASGWLVLAAALVSPLHQAGERSFTAHMIEHELLMLLAAPLLVLGEPGAAMLWAFPGRARRLLGAAAGAARPLWNRATGAVAATLVQAAVLWIWHLPSLFDRALASDGWHVAQHLSFIVAALLFWTAMLGRRAAAAPAARALAILCLFLTSVVSGALGALMAFSTSPWYAGYASLGMAPFGLSPAEDQQLAGLVMWVPGGLVHAGAALILARSLLRPDRMAAHAG